jgi:hypothetical protein
MVETPKLGVSTSSHPDAQIGRLYIISPRRPKLASLHIAQIELFGYFLGGRLQCDLITVVILFGIAKCHL